MRFCFLVVHHESVFIFFHTNESGGLDYDPQSRTVSTPDYDPQPRKYKRGLHDRVASGHRREIQKDNE